MSQNMTFAGVILPLPVTTQLMFRVKLQAQHTFLEMFSHTR